MRASGSPIPVPSGRVELKSLKCASGSGPGPAPSSAIVTRAPAPSDRQRQRMRPPSRQAAKAFNSRLSTAWRSIVRSPSTGAGRQSHSSRTPDSRSCGFMKAARSRQSSASSTSSTRSAGELAKSRKAVAMAASWSISRPMASAMSRVSASAPNARRSSRSISRFRRMAFRGLRSSWASARAWASKSSEFTPPPSLAEKPPPPAAGPPSRAPAPRDSRRTFAGRSYPGCR